MILIRDNPSLLLDKILVQVLFPKYSVLISNFPCPKRQNLDASKLKEFADDSFKFDENGGRISKSVENTRYEQFLLF